MRRPVGSGDEDGRETFDIIKTVLKKTLQRPIVVGMAEKETTREFPFYGFLLVDAGDAKAELTAELARFESLADEGDIIDLKIGDYKMHGPKEPDDVPGYWGWVGNYFVFVVNDAQGSALKNLGGEVPAGNQALLSRLDKISGSGDILSLYIDIQKTADQIENAIIAEEGEDAKEGVEKIKTVLEKLGIRDVRSITASMDFDGPDLLAEALLEVPQPHKGLLNCLGTIDMAYLDAVDSRAGYVGLANVNLPGVYDTIIAAVETVAPADIQEFQQNLAKFELEAGFHIRQGLLGSLAGPVVLYSLPAGAVMEAPIGGAVLLAQLSDPARMTKSLIGLENFARATQGSNGESPAMLAITINTIEVGDHQVHVWMVAPLAMMQVSPCWTIIDNQLLISTNLPILKEAIKQSSSDEKAGNSIRTTANFNQIAQDLPDEMISFEYIDTKVARIFLVMGQTPQGLWRGMWVTAGVAVGWARAQRGWAQM